MGNNRSALNHPALNTTGGPSLWNAIDTIYQLLSDNDLGRWMPFSALANSGTTTLTHGFGVPFTDLKVVVYTGTYPNLIQNPSFGVIANGANPKTQIDLTAPGSGGPFSGYVLVVHDVAWQQRNVTTAQRNAITSPNKGMLVFDTDLNSLYVYMGSAWVAAGAGAGSGELNVISNPNDANLGWAASGAGITLATSSISTDLPLGGISPTSIKITPVSGTDYVYYRFSIPAALKQRKLKIQWEQRPLSGYTSGDLKVDMYTNSASNYGGSYTRRSLSTDASSITSIPNLTGRFVTTWDTDSSDYYELRFTRVAGAIAINIANVIIGPGIQPQGTTAPLVAVLSLNTSTSYPTGARNVVYDTVLVNNGLTIAGNDTVVAPYTGIMTVSGFARWASTPSGFQASVFINGGGLPNNNGFYTDFNAALTVQFTPMSFNVNAGDLVTIQFYQNNGTNSLGGSDQNFMRFEMSPGGPVNLAQNDVEYASNFNTGDIDNITSFAYGPAGSTTPAASGASSTIKRVRFPSPILPTDQLTLEYAYQAGGPWMPLVAQDYQTGIQQFMQQGSAYYGIGIDLSDVTGVATDVNVKFGRYAGINGGNGFGGIGLAWNTASGFWRVKKTKAGVAAGFGAATTTQRGLVTLPKFQTKYATTAVSPSYPATIFSFNLVPGQTYLVSYMLSLLVFQPSGFINWNFALYDSGNPLVRPVGTRVASYLSSGAWVNPDSATLSEIITMSPAGNGILELRWTDSSGSNAAIYTLGTGYTPETCMTVREYNGIANTTW